MLGLNHNYVLVTEVLHKISWQVKPSKAFFSVVVGCRRNLHGFIFSPVVLSSCL